MFWGITAWLGGGVFVLFCFFFCFRKLLERAGQPENGWKSQQLKSFLNLTDRLQGQYSET